jgi:hypothetical protein
MPEEKGESESYRSLVAAELLVARFARNTLADQFLDVGTLKKVRNAGVSVGVGEVEVPPTGRVRGWLGHT